MANEEKTPGDKLQAALAAGDKRSRENGQELIRQHREAGISMFVGHDAYPGQVIEITPEGRWFIVDMQNGQEVRIREVEPQPSGE